MAKVGNGSAQVALTEQLDRQRRTVSYDSYDILVRELINLVEEGSIDIAPDYQRQFIWPNENQSRFVESIFLGIPVPSLYMATNKDSTWELIDGVQRVSTIIRFYGSEKLRHKVLRANTNREPLVLDGLEKLDEFNGQTFDSLPKSLQLAFTLKSVRVTVLNDKSDLNVRFDLFERLNTGGVKLQPQEIRNCIFRGIYNDFLRECGEDKSFRKVIKLQAGNQHNGTYEELVLRFFAYLHEYKSFEHEVTGFLNDYMAAATDKKAVSPRDRKIFLDTHDALAQHLPSGVVRPPRKITPLNLYEGIAVGTALALRDVKRTPKLSRLKTLLSDEKLRDYTTGATNNLKMVAGRIEYVRDYLLKP